MYQFWRHRKYLVIVSFHYYCLAAAAAAAISSITTDPQASLCSSCAIFTNLGIMLQSSEFMHKGNCVNCGSSFCYCRELIALHYSSFHLQWNQNPFIGKAVVRFWPCPPLLAPSCWVPMWTFCLFLELAKPSTLCSALACGVLSEWNLPCRIWFLLVTQGSAQLLLFLRWPSLASLPKIEPPPTLPKTPPSLSSPTHHPLIACLCLFLWNSSVSEITF